MLSNLKEWWWAYFIGAIIFSGIIGWWQGLDFSYGSPACAIPIIGSWVIAFAIIIPGIIAISNEEA